MMDVGLTPLESMYIYIGWIENDVGRNSPTFCEKYLKRFRELCVTVVVGILLFTCLLHLVGR